MSYSRIAALGHYQPERILTNDDLAAMVDTSDEWIRRRTGIVTRRIAAEDESVADMASAAASKALAAAGMEPDRIGLVIVSTSSAMDRCPSIAAQTAGRLGIPAPACYDVNNACAGFTTALASADHALRADAADYALVVGAEKMSDLTDWTDRSTNVLLGDGAGAAVLAPSKRQGIGPVVWGSDPSRRDAVRLAGAWQPRFEQDGQAVYRWATTALASVARTACERAGIEPADLDGIVTHQANLRIIEAITARLGTRDVTVAEDVIESGNTSSASIPLAFSKLVARGDLRTGGKVLLLGFGGGLSWAGQVVDCP